MNKYLYNKIDQAHGAFIEEMIFIANELCKDSKHDLFDDFEKTLETEEILTTLDWVICEKNIKLIEENKQDGELITLMYNAGKTGFLAECHFPECANFTFNEKGEPISWSVRSGICKVEYLYADSIGELVEKLVEASNDLFEEAVEKEKNDINK
jgi:hypothetical protein